MLSLPPFLLSEVTPWSGFSSFTVRSWASEVDHLGLVVLLSVMSITNERNFSVPLDKETINVGDDTGHIITL